MKHFVSIADTSPADLKKVITTAMQLREQRIQGQKHTPVLDGRSLAMIFEKPSLRTRVSFEQAIYELGGQAVVLTGGEVGLGKREPVADVIRVLEGMVHGVIARVFEHQKLLDMVEHGSIPIVNALSDYSHPCQAVADVMTVMDEFGEDLTGRTLTFVGDGNNVARSLAIICGRLGMNFILASPAGYELEESFVDRIMSQEPNMNFEITHDAKDAVNYADVIYTDTWVSMGQEEEKARRLKAFADFQVNQALLDCAPEHAIVLHCLPAYRELEISTDVIEGKASRVFPQAHNRLHAQKGLLAVLYGG